MDTVCGGHMISTRAVCLGMSLATSAWSAEPATPAQLATLSLQELMDVRVVVTSASAANEQLIDAPAPMVVLTRQELVQRGYTNLIDVFKDLPGFDVAQFGGNNEFAAYQRGYRTTTFDRTLVLLDGRPYHQLWAQSVPLFHQFPVQAIERIEVLYGPAGAIYGPNAYLGVVNIITANGSELSVGKVSQRARAAFGSWNTRDIDVALQSRPSDRIRLSISGKLYHTAGADLSQRDNKWLHNDYLGSPEIHGPLLEFSHMGHEFGTYANPDDDYMLLAKLGLGKLELGAHAMQASGSNGPEFTGDHTQSANAWPARFSELSATYPHAFTDAFSVTSSAWWQRSRRFGNWADALPSDVAGEEQYSYVAFVDFHTINDGLFWQQRAVWQPNDALRLTSGYRVVRKHLTKAYDIGDGYWGAFNSNGPDDNSAIYSTVPVIQPDGSIWYMNYETGVAEPFEPGQPAGRMPHENQVWTDDIGAFTEANLTMGPIRLNAGIRYDVNSNPQAAPFNGHRGYKAISPRVGAIYKWEKTGLVDVGAVKLLYGQAIQEPAGIQLWGGWNGRNAAEDLRPEHAQNLETVFIVQTGRILTDISAFYARYDGVHVTPPANAGSRTILGAEYKGQLLLPNPVIDTDPVAVSVSYSYNHGTSSHRFNFANGAWQPGDGTDVIGDIAPHKVHGGLFIPVTEAFDFGGRTSWISGRQLYLRNALRDPNRPDGGRRLPAYTELDFTTGLNYGPVRLAGKVKNALDAQYFHPGAEKADTGDDRSAVRSSGWMNSLVPQPGRAYYLTLTVDL